MLYISFLTLNWLLINILIMIILVALVVTVKIWQYFRRWGDSRSLNLNYLEKTLDLNGVKFEYFEIFKKNDQEGIDNPKDLQKPVKTIILFTPFLLNIQKIFYLATAIAEINYRVIVFQSSSFLDNISEIISTDKSRKETAIQSTLSEINTYFNPQTFIGFDLIAPLLFQSWASNDNQVSDNQTNDNEAKINELKSTYIGIRPILSKKELNIFSKFPLTYRWFFLLRLKIQGGMKYFNQVSFQSDKSSMDQKIEPNESEEKRIYLIYPDKSLRPKAKIKQFLENLKITNKNNHELRWDFIHGGGFSFREQETIVLSLILKRISRSSG